MVLDHILDSVINDAAASSSHHHTHAHHTAFGSSLASLSAGIDAASTADSTSEPSAVALREFPYVCEYHPHSFFPEGTRYHGLSVANWVTKMNLLDRKWWCAAPADPGKITAKG